MASSTVRLDSLIAQVADEHPADHPLDRVAAACQLVADLDEIGDHLVGHFIDEARAAGLSWTQIGEHIGVTKQAARKRFAPRHIPEEAATGTGLRDKARDRARDNVFGRYTDHARHAIVLAQEDARSLGHAYIGTGHILLGICQEDRGLGARVLAAAGVSLAELRDAVTRRLGPATAQLRGHIPFDQEAKKALELTARASLLLDDDHIGTEHVLLGLIADGADPASQALSEAGITTERVRAEISRLRTA